MSTVKKTRKRFYGAFFLILRFLARPFVRLRAVPAGYPAPCVYVCRHKNMQGPVYIAANFRESVRIWVLGVFLSREECFRQYYEYTFTKRYGWPRALAYIVAKLASYVVPAFMRSMRAICVYRGTMSIIRTYRASISALLEGNSLVIFPDIDYKSEDDEGVAFYDGFLLLNRYYRRKAGKPLPFVPLYVDEEGRRILMGDPIFFKADDQDAASAREGVLKELIRAIDDLSRSE